MSLLTCSGTNKDGTPHGPFRTPRGAAFHATRCATYRAENGIPDDAPGVIKPREKVEPTVADILAGMAAYGQPATAAAAEPVTLADVLAAIAKR